MSVFRSVLTFLVLLVISFAVSAEEPKLPPSEVFNQRILPIFRSEKPSSCVQCHLASVDLKNYILPSHEQTFLSLRDQGLIDLKNPEESKILKLIRMGDKDLDEGAKLIHEKLRKQEQEAFANWIEACCHDESLVKLPPLSEEQLARPAAADEVIRHSRKSRIVDSFTRNVWSQRMRCFPCHTPHEIDPENPRHAAAIKTRNKLAAEYGNRMERLNIFRKTPEATLNSLVRSSMQPPKESLPMLNLDNPKNSLLVLKPTSKLPAKNEDGTLAPPSSVLPVTHMGGLKMHPQDQSYKSFVTWIEDYAKSVRGEYKSVEELPADNWYPSQYILRLSETPEEWEVGMTVQLFVHRRDEDGGNWSPEPIAFTQGTITPRHFVNGALILFSDAFAEEVLATSGEESPFADEDYSIKVHIDRGRLLDDDPTALLGDQSFIGAVDFNARRWRPGFKTAKVISAKDF